MKEYFKKLLSRKVLKRVALNFKLSNIKLKVLLRSIVGFRKLTGNLAKISFTSLLLFFFSGYYPVRDFPPVKSSAVLAQDSSVNEQKAEIIASSFPQPVILPHPGYLSTKFSRFHPGVDIAASLGMPIHPVTSGTIESISSGFWGYGNHIIISHPNGFKSLYGHLGKIFAKIGQEVTTDTILGEVGMTGLSSGPHTHLEITNNGKYINPLLILPEISMIQSLPPKQ